MYMTQTDLTNLILQESGTASDSKVLKDAINTFNSSPARKDMIDADAYYSVENTAITNRVRQYYSQKSGWTKLSSAKNKKLIHGFYWMLVEQKIAYILGKAPTFTTENKETETEFLPYFQTSEFHDLLRQWSTNGSNAGVGWLHVYPDENGDFAANVIPSEQIIPIYDTRYEKNLVAVIRYFQKEYVGVNQKELRYYVEWWTAKDVSIYEQNQSGNFDKIETKPHMVLGNTANQVIKNATSWGKPPFVRLVNNRIKKSDLHFVKSLIDDYDKNRSDESNMIEETPNSFLAVKGYQGDVGNPDKAAQAIGNIRESKAAFLAVDGDITPISNEHPTQAIQQHEQNLKEDIFMCGMGVDFATDKFGNAPSGVALQFLYQNLDLKSDLLIQGLQFAVKELFAFYNYFNKLRYNKEYDISDIEMVCNKSMLVNEMEIIQKASLSKGLISDETIIANHPWVTDVDEEMKKMEKQNQVNMERAIETMKAQGDETEQEDEGE